MPTDPYTATRTLTHDQASAVFAEPNLLGAVRRYVAAHETYLGVQAAPGTPIEERLLAQRERHTAAEVLSASLIAAITKVVGT